MASGGEEAAKKPDNADAPERSSVVHVESVEKSSLFSFLRGSSSDDDESVKKPTSSHSPSSQSHHGSETKQKEPTSHKHEVVHDGSHVKTTYDVEEPPSVLEQVKTKLHWNGR